MATNRMVEINDFRMKHWHAVVAFESDMFSSQYYANALKINHAIEWVGENAMNSWGVRIGYDPARVNTTLGHRYFFYFISRHDAALFALHVNSI